MEWVETTAKTLEEARELALDKLGVDESEAEFELLEEPKAGLFGRTRGQARVRARVEPKGPRPKNERRDKRKKSSDKPKAAAKPAKEKASADDSPAEDAPKKRKPRQSERSDEDRASSPRQQKESAPIEEVRETVQTFLTGLSAAFGYDSAVQLPEEDDTINAVVDGKHGLMVGPRGRTLDAIQELTRVAAQRTAPSGVRIRVDVGSYRELRKEALATFAVKAAATARDEQLEVVLEPMSSADRKTLHDALNEQEGVSTRSAGNEPRRRVIVVPSEGTDTE